MLGWLSWTLTASGALVTSAVARWAMHERRRKRRARELERLSDDQGGSTAHLSPALAHLTRQARVVRLTLATPMGRYRVGLLHDTPWGRRAACDQYDLAISDARRALWEWLLLFRHLREPDRQILVGLGVSLTPFYAALFKPGVFDRSDDLWEETLLPAAPDLSRVFAELRRTMHDLRSFEVALLGHGMSPYRR